MPVILEWRAMAVASPKVRAFGMTLSYINGPINCV